MSSRSNSRRSFDQMHRNLNREIRQSCLPPQTRSVRSRPSTMSTRWMKQQTITQMEPFHTIYHPVQDDDLAYEEAINEIQEELQPLKRKRRKTMPAQQESTLTQIGYVSGSLQMQDTQDVLQHMVEAPIPEASFRKNKRRKTMSSGPTATVQTRSMKKQAMQQMIKDEEEAASAASSPRLLSVDTSEDTIAAMALSSMPPPKTPKSIRRKEIPSSQSPADTPLSTRSGRSQHEISRSPLKQKSTNISTDISRYLQSPRKSARQASRLAIADSIESSSTVESSIFARPGVRRQYTVPTRADMTNLALELREGSPALDEDAIPVSHDLPDQFVHNTAKQAEIIKSEIMDSDQEDLEDILQDSGSDDDHYANHSYQNPSFSFNEDDSRSTFDHSITNPHDEPYMPNHKISHLPKAQVSSRSPHQPHARSDSQEASAQLTAEFIRTTQPPPLVESDSQREATWHPYSGPIDAHYRDQQEKVNSSSPAPSSPPPLIISRLSHHQSHSTSSPFRLPPSQASTVDVTPPASHQPNKVPHSNPPPTPSSPPPMPPTFSSSPLRARKHGEPYMGYMGPWNGERLTDSQLLPESLMNDSMPEAASLLLGEEDWEGEEVL